MDMCDGMYNGCSKYSADTFDTCPRNGSDRIPKQSVENESAITNNYNLSACVIPLMKPYPFYDDHIRPTSSSMLGVVD